MHCFCLSLLYFFCFIFNPKHNDAICISNAAASRQQEHNNGQEYDWDDPETQAIADEKFGIFLFSHGIAWHPFESAEWRDYMSVVNPKLKIVPRNRLSNELLNKVDADTDALVKTVKFLCFYIKSACLCVCIFLTFLHCCIDANRSHRICTESLYSTFV